MGYPNLLFTYTSTQNSVINEYMKYVSNIIHHKYQTHLKVEHFKFILRFIKTFYMEYLKFIYIYGICNFVLVMQILSYLKSNNI